MSRSTTSYSASRTSSQRRFAGTPHRPPRTPCRGACCAARAEWHSRHPRSGPCRATDSSCLLRPRGRARKNVVPVRLFADYPRAASMGFRGFLRDRQAESGSRRPMPRFLGPIESLEDPLPIGGLDRRTLIVYADDNLSQILVGGDGDGRSRRRILGRVIDELLQRVRQNLAVGVDLQMSRADRARPHAGREAGRDIATGRLQSA